MEMFLFKLYCYLPCGRFTSPIKDLLSKIACPLNAEEHFWHDGCPACWEYDEWFNNSDDKIPSQYQ